MTSTPRLRAAIFMMAACAIVLAALSLQTVDRFALAAKAVQTCEFGLKDVRFAEETRKLTLVITVSNKAPRYIVVDDLRFSLYLDDAFIVTNPESRLETMIAAGKSTEQQYVMALEPYFAERLGGDRAAAGIWRVSGQALIRIEDIRPRLPARVNLRKAATGR